MDISHLLISWLVILGLLAPIITNVVGIAVLGRSFRDSDGELTRYGKLQMAGYVVAAIFAVVVGWGDYAMDKSAATAASARTEMVERAALRSSLSTTNARLNMTVSIDIRYVAEVDPNYAARLKRVYEYPEEGCKISTVSKRGYTVRFYRCHEFEVYDQPPLPRFIKFDQHSALFPRQDGEMGAWELLVDPSVQLSLSPTNGNRYDDIENFLFSSPGVKTRYPLYDFDGKTIKIVLQGAKVFLQSLNVSSITDMLGRHLSLQTSGIQDCLDVDPMSQMCKKLKVASNCDFRLLHFALIFPHGRDIVFQRGLLGNKMAYMQFIESKKLPGKCSPLFTYTFPNSVEKFMAENRSIPFFDRWPNPWGKN